MQYDQQEKKLENFLVKCKENNLKITPQRVAVFKELLKAKDHPSADTVFKVIREDFPNISFDTVNRTLLTLHEIGMVDVLETKGNPRRFEPDLENHHHFHCVRCGKIIDFHNDEYDNLKIPDNIRKQYKVLNKRVILNGLCLECMN